MNKSGLQPTRQFRGKLTRTSLLLILPMALIPVAILGIATLTSTNNFLREQITTQLINAGNKQGELIDDSIQARETFLQTIAEDATFRFAFDNLLANTPGSEEFRNARGNVMANYERLNRSQTETLFNYFLVVSPQKKILASTYPLWEGQTLDQGVYDQLLSDSTSVGLFNVFPFHTEEFTDGFLVFTSYQVTDNSAKSVGTLIGISGPTTFQRILELGTLSYAEAQSYYITNPQEEGLFVGISPTTGELTLLDPSPDHLATVVPKITSENKEGMLEFTSFNEEYVLAIVKWLPSIEAALILEVPQTAITEPLRASATLQITLLVIALIVLGVIIWQGTQRIVKPILQVSQTARNFADGDMLARAPIDRNDEIGLLAASFNQVADQLVSLYRSLEAQVEARTQQIRMAGEVAQISTSASNLEEMLRRTVQLIVERFGYYHAAIYLLDRGGDEAVLRQAAGKSADEFMTQGLHIAVGSRSIVGTVSATNRPWVASDVKQDPYYLQNESLPETASEAAVPLSISDVVLGVLDVQSNKLRVFDEEEVTTLQTLARQVASAIQNVRLLETTQVDLQSTNLLYQVSHRLAEASTKLQVFEILSEVLRQVPYITATFILEADTLQSLGISTTFAALIHRNVSIPLTKTQTQTIIHEIAWKIVKTQNPPEDLGDDLLAFAQDIGCETFVLMPLMSEDTFGGLIILGATNQNALTPSTLEPYHSISEMTNTALEKIEATEEITQRFAELQSLNLISQAISTETELRSLFGILHRQINQAMGDANFLIALYNAQTELIEIPYMSENQQIVSIPSFPLGQGLTSIVIRTQQPLMIVEDTVNRTRALGAIVTSDRPARSWLGVPMIVGGEVVGAMVVQDTEREYRFDEDDLRLLTTLAGQVAPTIRNARLLAEAQEAAERDRRLYQVTDKIRQANSIQSILEITTQELSKALNLKAAKIEISVDPTTISKRDNGSEEKPE